MKLFNRYPALTLRVLVAEKTGRLDKEDAKIALSAISARELPDAIARFIDVSIKIKETLDRSEP
jgi:hypothetical protein